MEISGLIIRILFLLLPGGFACVVYWRLVGRNSQKDWEDFLDIILFSLASYGIYALGLALLVLLNNSLEYGYPLPSFSYFAGFLDEKTPLNLFEIFVSCLIAIPLAALAALANNRLWISRVGRALRITYRVNEHDVWTYFQQSDERQDSWVVVRDHKLSLIYYGWIETYSDSGKNRELVLKEVSVFDNDGEFCYETPLVYIARNNDDLTIETRKSTALATSDETIKKHDSDQLEKDGTQEMAKTKATTQANNSDKPRKRTTSRATKSGSIVFKYEQSRKKPEGPKSKIPPPAPKPKSGGK